jgi:hypothetical protein
MNGTVGPGHDMQEWPLKWYRLSAQYSGTALNGRPGARYTGMDLEMVGSAPNIQEQP